jgi:hypothetical protein
MDKIILSFSSYTQVYGAQKKLLSYGINTKIQRAFRETSEEGCGYVLIADIAQKQQILNYLTQAGYRYKVTTEKSPFWGGGI